MPFAKYIYNSNTSDITDASNHIGHILAPNAVYYDDNEYFIGSIFSKGMVTNTIFDLLPYNEELFVEEEVKETITITGHIKWFD